MHSECNVCNITCGLWYKFQGFSKRDRTPPGSPMSAGPSCPFSAGPVLFSQTVQRSSRAGIDSDRASVPGWAGGDKPSRQMGARGTGCLQGGVSPLCSSNTKACKQALVLGAGEDPCWSPRCSKQAYGLGAEAAPKRGKGIPVN